MKQKRATKLLKIIDRYFGRVALALIFLLKKIGPARQSFTQQVPDRLAVFCIAAIGDLILLSEPIRALKNKYPRIQITLFCGPDNFSAVSIIDPNKKIFTEVIKLEPKSVFKTLSFLRKQKFDVVVDSGQWARISAIYAWIACSKWLIGFSTPGQNRGYIFDQKIEHSSKRHELENYTQLFANWIVSEEVAEPKVFVEKKELPPLSVILHPFAAGERNWQKEWENEKWNELASDLLAKGFKIYITGGPADETKVLDVFTANVLERCHNLAGKLSLKETGQYIAGAEWVVSVNTGIMHLAAAIGVKLIALHGPTNPLRWGPVSKRAYVLSANLTCSPCLNLGFEYGCPKNTCMQSLTTKQVEDIILRS